MERDWGSVKPLAFYSDNGMVIDGIHCLTKPLLL
jgi:hypothetical protein